MTNIIETAIFGEIAQNCDYWSRMIIECNGNNLSYVIWGKGNENEDRHRKTKTYKSPKTAYSNYLKTIGRALRNGWSLRELQVNHKTLCKYQYKNGTKGNYKGVD